MRRTHLVVLALAGASAVMLAVVWRAGWGSTSSTPPSGGPAGSAGPATSSVQSVGAVPEEGDGAWTTSVSALRAAPAGAVTIVDVRSARDYGKSHIPGAVRVSWLDYRDGWGRTGKLDRDVDRIARAMAELGVDSSRPVIVYGKAREGWGEEGRVAWMLYYLGHPKVTILDGGWPAWQRAGAPTNGDKPNPARGNFTAHVRADVRAFADDVARASSRAAAASPVILDTRSDGEWNGSRKYFPARTGRIPGAVHIEWQDLLTPDGFVDRSPEQLERLRALGLTPERAVIAYCVGGVRSGEAFFVLRALGFDDVRNYDGSWYEWAADKSRPIERAK